MTNETNPTVGGTRRNIMFCSRIRQSFSETEGYDGLVKDYETAVEDISDIFDEKCDDPYPKVSFSITSYSSWRSVSSALDAAKCLNNEIDVFIDKLNIVADTPKYVTTMVKESILGYISELKAHPTLVTTSHFVFDVEATEADDSRNRLSMAFRTSAHILSTGAEMDDVIDECVARTEVKFYTKPKVY